MVFDNVSQRNGAESQANSTLVCRVHSIQLLVLVAQECVPYREMKATTRGGEIPGEANVFNDVDDCCLSRNQKECSTRSTLPNCIGG